MNYAKMLGLVALAAAALMAFASPASATYATSPKGTTYTGTVKATSPNFTLAEGASFGFIKCGHSEVEGSISSHSTTSTVTTLIKLSKLTITSCSGGEATSPVAVPGFVEVHTVGATSNGNGTATWNGASITFHKMLIGTCTFVTSATDIGQVIGSINNLGKTAVLEIGSASIPQKSGNPFCGSAATLTGTYTFLTPDYLDID